MLKPYWRMGFLVILLSSFVFSKYYITYGTFGGDKWTLNNTDYFVPYDFDTCYHGYTYNCTSTQFYQNKWSEDNCTGSMALHYSDEVKPCCEGNMGQACVDDLQEFVRDHNDPLQYIYGFSNDIVNCGSYDEKVKYVDDYQVSYIYYGYNPPFSYDDCVYGCKYVYDSDLEMIIVKEKNISAMSCDGETQKTAYIPLGCVNITKLGYDDHDCVNKLLKNPSHSEYFGFANALGIPILDCTDVVCSNKGFCYDGKCNCTKTGYTGPTCEIEEDSDDDNDDDDEDDDDGIEIDRGDGNSVFLYGLYFPFYFFVL